MPFFTLKQKASDNPEIKAEYDALSDEFELVSTLIMITMREQSGLTQDDVAKKWGSTRQTSRAWNLVAQI